MELSDQDNLRLNVLLSQDLHAVRIDEADMSVHALTGRGEARVSLNPTGRHEQYLRRVRELLSTHVLGSPGGYPIYLRRWTRMGQARDESLARLLMLGEPEAVVAVVHAAGLTDELARRAWWAMPTADNARCMLRRPEVAGGSMGPVLAEFLLDYLPFETESGPVMESVGLVLQPGLIDEAARDGLWAKARRKNVYYVGFLFAVPDDLPAAAAPHPGAEAAEAALADLAGHGNACAAQLRRVLGAAGQGFLATAEAVLAKPNDQDVALAVLEAIAAYFESVRPDAPDGGPDIEAILAEAAARVRGAPEGSELAAVRAAAPALADELSAMLALAAVGEPLVAPIFARTDAIGTVMRRRLEPVFGPVLEQLGRLRAGAVERRA